MIRSTAQATLPGRLRMSPKVTVKFLELEHETLFGLSTSWVAVCRGARCCPDAPPEMLHLSKAHAKTHATQLVTAGEWK